MRILLVEDEPSVASFIIKGLKEEGYLVDHALQGGTGLDYALAAEYDLFIFDIMLPGMDGFELLRQVRIQGLQTPVLMLTARISTQDKVKGLDLGADDYLTKPFSFEEFLARVRALCRRKDNRLVELHLGELFLDVRAHRVMAKGEEINLRPKEYAILEYLMRSKDRVVSRTQILENVWGYDFDPTTNVVDVHIKSIRKELKNRGLPEMIRTIRGRGYMMEDPG